MKFFDNHANDKDGTLRLPRMVLWAAMMCLVGFTAVGCGSTGSKKIKTGSLAAVVIHSTTAEQIQKTAVEVFKQDLYQVVTSSPTRLVFEKPGSRMSDIAYGNWFDQSVWVRVKVDIKSYTQNSFILQCDAFMVRDHGESFFEDETRLRWYRAKPFRKLLERVQNRLN